MEFFHGVNRIRNLTASGGAGGDGVIPETTSSSSYSSPLSFQPFTFYSKDAKCKMQNANDAMTDTK